MASWDITKEAREAGLTAADLNAAIPSSFYTGAFREGDEAGSVEAKNRDYADRALIHIAKAMDERKAEQEIEAREAGTITAEPATARQVAYIMSMIDAGAHEEGGLYRGPTTLAEVRKMSKREASLYITSLKGEY